MAAAVARGMVMFGHQFRSSALICSSSSSRQQRTRALLTNFGSGRCNLSLSLSPCTGGSCHCFAFALRSICPCFLWNKKIADSLSDSAIFVWRISACCCCAAAARTTKVSFSDGRSLSSVVLLLLWLYGIPWPVNSPV